MPTSVESQNNIESDHWFDEVNRKVTSQLDGLGDDPPFFLDNVEARISSSRASPSPEDPILSYMRSNDCDRENEELRGIIDDLTLDMRRMKRKLRRYKEANPPHLCDDKLFEIRVHRLSNRQKRQLEGILERFAAEVSASSRFSKNSRTSRRDGAVHGQWPLPPPPPLPPAISREEACMALLAAVLEQLCSPENSKKLPMSTLLKDGREGWFGISEVLGFVKQAASSVNSKPSLEALRRYSRRLDISADGRCVRWKGAAEGSTESNRQDVNRVDSQDASISSSSSSVSDQEIPLGLDNLDVVSRIKRNPYYTPSVFLNHANDADDEMISVSNSDSESAAPAAIGDAHASQPVPPKTRHGRTAYYKDAPFYIDYSRDGIDQADQCKASSKQSKKRQRRQKPKHSTADRFNAYGTEHNDKEHKELSSPVISLNDEQLSSIKEGEHTPQPIELEASGIGDVVPDDNFAVHVKVKHTSLITTSTTQPRPSGHASLNHLSRKLTSRPKDKPTNRRTFSSHIITSTHQDLAPSSLPPPTYGFFSSTGSEEEEEEEEESTNSGLSCSGYGVDERKHVSSIQRWRTAVVSSLENNSECQC